MSNRDYYEVLGLTPRADGAMVDQAYWHLVRKYQSLAAMDPRAEQRIDELNEAYAVLGTPRRREEYDGEYDFGSARTASTKRARASRRAEAARVGPKDQGRTAVPLTLRAGRWHAAVAGAVLVAVAAGLWALGAGTIAAGPLAVLGVALVAIPCALTLRRTATQSVRPTASPDHAPEPVDERDLEAPPVEEREPRYTRRVHLPDAQVPAPPRRTKGGASELRTSTAAMIERWRTNVAQRGVTEAETEASPDTTLVDIFRSEEQIERDEEPLTAVLDVLRGAKSPAETR